MAKKETDIVTDKCCTVCERIWTERVSFLFRVKRETSTIPTLDYFFVKRERLFCRRFFAVFTR